MNKGKNIYPDIPDPYSIEIEVTNYCNAKCVFCSHKDSKRIKGFMDISLFANWISKMVQVRQKSWINKKIKRYEFPKIVFGGLGEALLHPQIFEMINLCKKYGFRTQIITNGLTLTQQKQEKLIESCVDEIAISFHTINPKIFNIITGLSFDLVYNNIKNFFDKCDLLYNKPKVELWRIKPPLGYQQNSKSDEEKYRQFIKKYSWLTVLGPSEPWTRDGAVVNSRCDIVNDDPFGQIWCHKIWFTINLAWNGDVVLCCNDYNRISVDLGNAFSDEWSLEKYNDQKQKIILNREVCPEICKRCRRWKDQEYFEIVDKFI